MASDTEYVTIRNRTFAYRWVIVAASSVLLAGMAGIMYTYGIFFKHLIADFGWNREMTSGVYSLFVICHGLFGIPMGLIVDRFGPRRVMTLCTFIAGLGLVLTSRITALWQLYLTFGLIVGSGFSVFYGGTMATASRWFVQKRGLALGLVASGIGIGTLVLIPLVERLINATGWSTSYLIIGFATWAIMIPCALLMRRSPSENQHPPQEIDKSYNNVNRQRRRLLSPEIITTIKTAVSHRAFWMLASFLFFFNFCLQMTMVHLVNYATDLGISSLVAATFISFIGVSGFFGRILMGASADRIGTNNATLLCGIFLGISFIILLLTREVWTFYLFAIIFGFSYGGEVPQTPALVARYFGLKAVAALVGMVVAFAGFGGAIGSWLAGRIFDITQSYQAAFTVAIAASLMITVILIALKRVKPAVGN